jgi:hypothetical protein
MYSSASNMQCRLYLAESYDMGLHCDIGYPFMLLGEHAGGRDAGNGGQRREGVEDSTSSNVVPSRKDPLRTAVQAAAASGVLVADSSFDEQQQDQASPIMTASFDAI